MRNLDLSKVECWRKLEKLPEISKVGDFDELLEVMNSPELMEFMYVIEHGKWKVVLK